MNEEAALLVTVVGKDESGFPVESSTEIPIWVKEKSATRSEVYQAMRAGVTVKTVFQVRQEDYDLSAHLEEGRTVYATKIRHNDTDYDIVRTYRTDKAMIELTCA